MRAVSLEIAEVREVVIGALREGRMGVAVRSIEAALSIGEDPELHLLRGQIALIAADFEVCRRHLEAAVRGFEAAARPARAAVAAGWLGEFFIDGLGQRVVGRGWLARAWRMVADEPPCVEQGWVALALVGRSIADATELETKALLALELARRFGDVELEARALADGGVARVSMGRISEGWAWLDEGMTLVNSGMVTNPMVGGVVTCSMLSACERTGDLVRAEGWMQALKESGALDQPTPMLVAHCHAIYGHLLCEVGRWPEAEQALGLAVETASLYGHQLMSRAALAELRVRQGRLDEAEWLLLGMDDRIEAITPLARLHLVRGDYDLAASMARRGVRLLHADCARSVPLLALLVEAELGRGDKNTAAAVSAELSRVAAGTGQSALAATSAFAAARVAAAGGDTGSAVAELERALAALAEDLPLLRATIHLQLARLHAADDPACSRSEAQAALAIHVRVGAPLTEEAAILLRELGVNAPTAKTSAATLACLQRDGDYWTIRHGATTARLRDSKGLRYLAELVAHPGVERHVFDLVDLVEGISDSGIDRRRLGDAGELLDATAKTAYRRQLECLRAQMDDADACGNEERSWQVQAEIDALVAELSRGMGLGGRDRRASSAAERARLNVTRALRAAIRRIEEAQQTLGRHLDRFVSTGIFCIYTPPADSDVRWTRPISAVKDRTECSAHHTSLTPI